MSHRRGFTLIELMAMVVVMVLLLGFLFGYAIRAARQKRDRAYCMKCHRQIGLAMIQYAGDHDDAFMPLVDAAGSEVPALGTNGTISLEPARSAFAVLLKQGYLTTTQVFICLASGDRVPEHFPTDYKNAPLKDLLLKESECSFGWDPTKNHSVDACCAIIADKPSKDVSKADEGTHKNNSDNHGKAGQCVFYNDGHVKWGSTPAPDAGNDPDIYTGSAAPGSQYWKSTWDAKVIR